MESIKLKDLAMTKSYEIVGKSLKAQRQFKTSEKDMKDMLNKMQEKHMNERDRDIHIIHH